MIYYAAQDDGAQGSQIQKRCSLPFHCIQWDVTNQALVHHWYRLDNGEPYSRSSRLSMLCRLWPETATAMAVKLDASAAH